MIFQTCFTVDTPGRGSLPIVRQINARLAESGISTGMCLIFVHHTSASLMLCENADPEVRSDLERFMQRLAPDGDPLFHHVDEGPDDMPAHVRSMLTGNALTVPVSGGHCDLGVWQGVYLWEHRTSAHRRKVSVTLCGE
ncbi:secondary thiamine-phosphate synthase enzyme [Thiogranum longum]|uniref:Secondary thiamine-phosphate synthase enzyme n=1 Tax=Thiogranum longum TaxID=1537524 RepID=A0A4R1HB50_9GAMM|nr:secondary thiamine-phosphate synthase enzyme YjbQ [Thiogranum longum]TCK19184.1 secondary thiamine-phosphate synthase enzyme [Thiogranum longum]